MLFRRAVFRWQWLPQPRRRLESPPPLLGPQAQLPKRWKRVAVERRLFWGRKWFPKQKRRLICPAPSAVAQAQLPAKSKRVTNVLPAHFWRKKWKAKPRPRNKAIVPAPAVAPPSILQDAPCRKAPQWKRNVFRYCWWPHVVRPTTPFIPPAPPDPIIATFKPRRLSKGVRAAIWKKKPFTRAKRKFSLPSNVYSTVSHLALISRATWWPRPRKRFNISVNGIPKSVTLGQASWSWTGTGLSVNAKTVIALPKKVWAWIGTGPSLTAPQVITLAQKSWRWLTRGVVINHITLAPVIWKWSTKGLTITVLWRPVTPQGGTWTHTNQAGGTWTKITPRTGGWTKK